VLGLNPGAWSRSARCARCRVAADSLAAFVGRPACNTEALCADLHRFAFLLGASDGDELFGEPTP
jgi:hypothetical protein